MKEISWLEECRSYGSIMDDPIQRCPEREAIIFEDRRLTYRALGEQIHKTARYFQRIGIRKGVHVGLISRNCPEFLIAEFALYQLGAIPVKMNWRLTAGELAHMLLFSDAAYAIYKPSNDQQGRELTALCQGKLHFVFLSQWDGHTPLERAAAGESALPVACDVSPEDEACYLYTSGTNGRPKCVVYTHGAMLAELKSALNAYSYPDGQRYQYIAQLFHSAAIGAHLSLTTGGTMVLMPQFEPKRYMESLISERINAISVVPTVLKWILDEVERNDYDLSNLRTINYSTCPIPPALLDRAMRRLNCKFYQCYGMTEMGSMVTVLSPEDHCQDDGAHLGSVGRPIDGAAMQILGEDGCVCRAGERGEICVKGPGRMKGYYKDPERTAHCFTDGWYRTGDIGYVDKFGYLNLCGRADDLIISGGENIYPGEIENVLMRLNSEIAEVVVYGVPDETWGEHVKASVVRAPGSQLTKDALKAFCRANMPSFRVPKEIEFLDALPKNASGKVLVQELKARKQSIPAE